MTHAYAPLTPAGRRCFATRVISEGRPVAHVAAEAGVARSILTKWMARYHHGGPHALEDYSSAPTTRLPVEVFELIDTWRRENKWSARMIPRELAIQGTPARSGRSRAGCTGWGSPDAKTWTPAGRTTATRHRSPRPSPGT